MRLKKLDQKVWEEIRNHNEPKDEEVLIRIRGSADVLKKKFEKIMGINPPREVCERICVYLSVLVQQSIIESTYSKVFPVFDQLYEMHGKVISEIGRCSEFSKDIGAESLTEKYLQIALVLTSISEVYKSVDIDSRMFFRPQKKRENKAGPVANDRNDALWTMIVAEIEIVNAEQDGERKLKTDSLYHYLISVLKDVLKSQNVTFLKMPSKSALNAHVSKFYSNQYQRSMIAVLPSGIHSVVLDDMFYTYCQIRNSRTKNKAKKIS